jgi:hypothetical protein
MNNSLFIQQLNRIAAIRKLISGQALAARVQAGRVASDHPGRAGISRTRNPAGC